MRLNISRAAASIIIFGGMLLGAIPSTVLASEASAAASAQPATTELPHVGFNSNITTNEISNLVADAFNWGINIAGHYELRYVYTQLESHPAFRGVNRLKPLYKLADASSRYATTINASTLYSGGAFDVAAEPVIIEAAPVENGRYWSIQAADQNANWFMMVGSQFTGNDRQRYVIVGPHWRGELPEGFKSTQIFKSSSNTFNIAVRVAVRDRSEDDLKQTRDVLDGVSVAPLSLWRKAGNRLPPLAEQPIVKGEFRTFPRMSQIVDYGRSMSAVDFLQLLSLSLNDSSFTRRTDSIKETTTLHMLEPIGLKQGSLFDPALLTPAQIDAAQKGFDAARRIARKAMERSFVDMNGWKLQSSLFYNDLDYVAKAGADDVAWGTPVPFQSHTIAYLFQDSKGKLLEGSKRYTLTFVPKNMPPVTEFWELPIYDSAGYFIPNEINRNSVTSYQLAAGQFTVRNGAVTFYIQPDRPKDPAQAKNWLPTKHGEAFQFAARFYGPMASLVDGSFEMPQLEPAN